MLKSSAWIKHAAETSALIDPFVSQSVREGVISYGLGPYGYDIRLHDTYKKVKKSTRIIDPHSIGEQDYESCSESPLIIPARSYILARSVEYFQMPRRVLGLVFGKSTYARCGVLVNVTPLEPEWEGYLTISVSNVSGRSVQLYPNQGIAQVLFLESDDLPLFSYRDLDGRYQGQDDIEPAKIQKSR